MKIKKIELQLSKKETIELTVEQARELRDILNDTFPVETKPEYVPYWPNYQPYIHWTYPIQQTWCGSSSSANVNELDLSLTTSDTVRFSLT